MGTSATAPVAGRGHFRGRGHVFEPLAGAPERGESGEGPGGTVAPYVERPH